MPRIQFSLKWMMIALTVACVLLFLSVTISDFVPAAVTFAFWCIVPTPIVILAVYGRGDRQAFAIGALVPWVTMIIFRVPANFMFFTALLWLLPMSALCGVLAAATRRWIIANQRDQPD
jgi:hypothetical protein